MRCIKSNDACKPLLFDVELVQRQLLYSGVFEVVQIQQSGLPFRLLQSDFLRRYRCLYQADITSSQDKTLSGTNLNVRILVDHLKSKHDLPRMQCGKTMVFYKGFEHRTLEIARNRLLDYQAPKLQRWLRMKTICLCYRRLLSYVTQLNANLISLDANRAKQSLSQLHNAISRMRGLTTIPLTLQHVQLTSTEKVQLLVQQVAAVAALASLKTEEQRYVAQKTILNFLFCSHYTSHS